MQNNQILAGKKCFESMYDDFNEQDHMSSKKYEENGYVHNSYLLLVLHESPISYLTSNGSPQSTCTFH